MRRHSDNNSSSNDPVKIVTVKQIANQIILALALIAMILLVILLLLYARRG